MFKSTPAPRSLPFRPPSAAGCCRRLGAFVWAGVLAVGGLPAAEVPAPLSLQYFRADQGIAAATVTNLPADLGATNSLRWKVPLDPGHSTPVVVGPRLFLTTYHAERQELATEARSTEDGKVLWRVVAPSTRLEAFHPANGSAAQASPACDGQRLFVFFGSYGLLCYDLDGRPLWQQPMGPFQDEFGSGSSPVLVGDSVVVVQDHDVGSFIMALDRTTGQVRWKQNRPDAVRSYSTPVCWTRQGKPELLVAGGLELAGYDPVHGERLWWTTGLARIVIPVPACEGDAIFMASWTPGGDSTRRITLDPWSTAQSKWDKDHNGRLARGEVEDPEVLDRFYRMDADQSGEIDQKEWERYAEVFRRAQNALLALRPGPGRGELSESALLWKHQRGVPYVASPLVHRGLVWMVKEGGLVTKLEAASGRVWQEERLPGIGNYFASPVAGQDRVYFASELGVVSVLAETTDWKLISSHDFHERIYATPILAKDGLFLRTERHLYRFATPGNSDAR